VAAVSVLAGAAAPSLAATKKPLPPIKGTWAYSDQTPDPSPSVTSNAPPTAYPAPCESPVPSGPGDVNKHVIVTKGAGTLEVLGTHTGDWAIELKDAKGGIISYSDGALPNDQEHLYIPLVKAGSYTVQACNLGGLPSLSAAYTFTYKK
jgi:hypothetical protein